MDSLRDNDPDLLIGRENSSRYFEIANATRIPKEIIAAAQGIKDDDLSEDTDTYSTIQKVKKHWIKRADRLFNIKFSNPDEARFAVLYAVSVGSVLQERNAYKEFSESEEHLRDKLVPLYQYSLSLEKILERPEYQEVKKVREAMSELLYTSSIDSLKNIGAAFRVAQQIGENRSREIEDQVEKVFEDTRMIANIQLLAQHQRK